MNTVLLPREFINASRNPFDAPDRDISPADVRGIATLRAEIALLAECAARLRALPAPCHWRVDGADTSAMVLNERIDACQAAIRAILDGSIDAE